MDLTSVKQPSAANGKCQFAIKHAILYIYIIWANRAVQWHCAKRAEAHFLAEAPEIIP